LTENTVACVLCHRTGRPAWRREDISWPSLIITTVSSCTAFGLCHRTGLPHHRKLEDISSAAVVADSDCQLYCICPLNKRRSAAELPVAYVIGRACHRKWEDISWPSSPEGTVSCTVLHVSCHRTGRPQETDGHQLAVVLTDPLYCICPQ